MLGRQRLKTLSARQEGKYYFEDNPPISRSATAKAGKNKSSWGHEVGGGEVMFTPPMYPMNLSEATLTLASGPLSRMDFSLVLVKGLSRLMVR